MKSKRILVLIVGAALAILLGIWIGIILKDKFISKPASNKKVEYVFNTYDLDTYVTNIMENLEDFTVDGANNTEEMVVDSTESEVSGFESKVETESETDTEKSVETESETGTEKAVETESEIK